MAAAAASPSAAVWLASYPDGAVRMRVEAGKGRRPRITVPPVPFLRELLNQHCGDGFDTQALYRLAGGRPVASAWVPEARAIAVTALAKLSSTGCHHEGGPLTEWDEQSRLQLLCYHNPLDAYSVQVEDIKVCVQAGILHHKVSRHEGEGGLSRISRTQPLFRAVWQPDGPGASVEGHAAAEVRLRRQAGLPEPDVPADAVPSVTAAATLRAWGIEGFR